MHDRPQTALARLLPVHALPIGLGCSRLGSLNGASGKEAAALLDYALAQGIRFFDTSDVYGQGDSERLVGTAVARGSNVVICSKAGKYLPWTKRAFVPLKEPLRKLARRSTNARDGVAGARAKPLPTRWDPAFLTGRIEDSLRRLHRDQIEMFMLHSPPAEVILQGDAVDALERARLSGKIAIVGISVDDVASADAALSDSRVSALQLPMRPGDTSFDDVASRAALAGVAVVARELLGGPKRAGMVGLPRDQITNAIRNPHVTLPLVGTTSMANLAVAIAAARSAA